MVKLQIGESSNAFEGEACNVFEEGGRYATGRVNHEAKSLLRAWCMADRALQALIGILEDKLIHHKPQSIEIFLKRNSASTS